ncbi:MAG: flagellar basal-body rod protein FlgG [bacterium]
MLGALHTAATGMDAQQLNMDVIANNLANVNTVGFKRIRADFQDLFYQTIRQAGTVAAAGLEIPTGIQIGYGTKAAATQTISIQGDLQRTENDLDFAIKGDGYFQVQLPTGAIAYTRAGALKKDGGGQMVTSDGYLLQPAITIPEGVNKITVGVDGTISYDQDGASQELGNLELAMFINPSGLSNIGENLYSLTAASGNPTAGTPGENGLGTILQGYLESSNVKMVEEMVNMITGQRAYEINSKMIQTGDSMLQIASNLKR